MQSIAGRLEICGKKPDKIPQSEKNMKTTIWKGAADRRLPTVYIHSVAGDGHNVWNRCREMGCHEFNLVSIHDFDFEGELTPWLAPGVRKGLPMFKGNAEAHLEKLLNEIMPEVEKSLPHQSSVNAIAGYSLAGLFAFWSQWKTNVFHRVGCGSASFWYPGFIDFINTHEIRRKPDYVYLSLGDNESNTKHPVMSRVGDCTAQVLSLLDKLEIPHDFETNPGNHFSDPDGRLAKAIKTILE